MVARVVNFIREIEEQVLLWKDIDQGIYLRHRN